MNKRACLLVFSLTLALLVTAASGRLSATFKNSVWGKVAVPPLRGVGYKPKITPCEPIITTIAGSGSDSDPAFLSPWGVALNAAGDLYIADALASGADIGVEVFRLDLKGTRSPLFLFVRPVQDMAMDAADNLYFITTSNVVVKFSDDGAKNEIVAGGGSVEGDGGPATEARLSDLSGIAVDRSGTLYIAGDHRIRVVGGDKRIHTVAGGGATADAEGVPATSASLGAVNGVAVDPAGNLYFSEWTGGSSRGGVSRIRRVDLDGTIHTVYSNYASDEGADKGGAFFDRLALDAAGNIYFVDLYGNKVGMIGADKKLHDVAGNGTYGDSGDGMAATEASLDRPRDIDVDVAGNVYIADSGNKKIRKVTACKPIIMVPIDRALPPELQDLKFDTTKPL
jgi:sugar lactone lactonase YvrE